MLALILSFIPPSQITTGSPAAYVIILIIGSAVFFVIPFIVYALRKPTWRDPKTTFVPFDWQIEGRKAGEKSKWVAGYEPTEAEIQAVLDKENKV